MFTFLIILIALIAVLLVLVVLLQSGQGGGLAGIAAGGATTQILGARQAPDVMEKATWTLASLFIVLCILTNFTIDTDEVRDSVIQQRTQGGATEQVLPQQPLPQQTQPLPDQVTPEPGTQTAPATPPATPPAEGGDQ